MAGGPDDGVEQAAHACRKAMAVAGRYATGGLVLEGGSDTTLVVTGAPIPALNGVFCSAVEPDVMEIEHLAAAQDWTGQPWCIAVRGRPTDRLLTVGARYGLVRIREAALLVTDLRQAAQLEVEETGLSVRRVRGSDQALYNDTVAAGFGVSPDVFVRVNTAALLDSHEASGYLAEAAGEPCATSLGVLIGNCLTVFNVATVPGWRRRGAGRAVTLAAAQEGLAAGARWVAGLPTPMGSSLYASLGAGDVTDRWTFLEPAERDPGARPS